MKKLLAVLLALMLLTASAAFAEKANLVQFNNFNLSVSGDGQEQSVNLGDLNAVFAIGAPDGVGTIQLDVDDGQNQLLGAEMQFKDNKVLLGIEGMERPIASPIDTSSLEATGEDPMEAIAMVFANIDQLGEVELPAFTGADIPKLNLSEIADSLRMFGMSLPVDTDANGVQSATFEVPAETLRQLFAILPAFIPEENKAQIEPALNELNQIFANGGGIALSGKLTDDGTTLEVLVDVLPVENGVTATTPVVGLYFTSTQNYDNFQVLLYQDGQSIPVATIELDSDPAAATLYVTVDVMGEFTLSFGLRPSEEIAGAQVVALDMNVDGESFSMSMVYGKQGDADFVDFAVDAMGQGAISLHVDETPDGNGGKTGGLDLRVVEASGQSVKLTADIQECVGDYTFRAVQNAENAYDPNNLSYIEQEAFEEDLMNAIAPLTNYFASLGA